AAIGVWIAYYYYIKHYPEKPKEMVEKFKGIYTTIQNKYYVDEIYGYLFVNGAKNLAKTLWIEFDVKVIDRTANLIAEFFRWSGSVIRVIQTGLLQDYALAILIGGVAVLYYFLK
ncbi:MAG: NADH-quinone oxidoreductase subunit L, partial [Deltaproteobacteria bacterium]|nr:NADH-quinone oxidoreductase subunit L [Deltaproteobacteria bacterium]